MEVVDCRIRCHWRRGHGRCGADDVVDAWKKVVIIVVIDELAKLGDGHEVMVETDVLRR